MTFFSRISVMNCALIAMLSFCASAFGEQTAELLGGIVSARLAGKNSDVAMKKKDGLLTIESFTADRWNKVQLLFPTKGEWKVGETLVFSAEVRTVMAKAESGEGWMVMALQQSGPPYKKAFRLERSVPQQWTKIQYPFTVSKDVLPGKSVFIIGLGNRRQKLELRNVSLKNFGSTPVSSISATKATYAGRELDAPWRAEADNRIDKYRKTDLVIHVVDASGNPLPDAVVNIQQTRHAFAFGSAVDGKLLLSDAPDAKEYQKIVKRDFNCVVLENDLKWPAWSQHRQQALDALGWLRKHDIQVRGHVLVWPSHRHMFDTRKFKDAPSQLDRVIKDHIKDEVVATRGLVKQWDVLNEPYDNHDAMDILGKQVMVEWFKAARQYDPDVELFINDYAILSGGGADTAHQNHYEQTISYIIAHGAPLDGIGLQSHFSSTLTSPTRVWSLLNRFGLFNKKLLITEFDVDCDSPELQADYTRDFMTICFSHPQVDGFIMWGFWEGRHWKPRAAIYNKNWSIRPAGKVWRDLVFKKWWTSLETKTDQSGKNTSRVFKGDYLITVESPMGKASKKVSTKNAEKTEITITLKNK